jgi:hypothetical protein
MTTLTSIKSYRADRNLLIVFVLLTGLYFCSFPAGSFLDDSFSVVTLKTARLGAAIVAIELTAGLFLLLLRPGFIAKLPALLIAFLGMFTIYSAIALYSQSVNSHHEFIQNGAIRDEMIKKMMLEVNRQWSASAHLERPSRPIPPAQ